ncbi:MAG: DUF4194 domain-containing protein [Symbiobacteriia bacterium]
MPELTPPIAAPSGEVRPAPGVSGSWTVAYAALTQRERADLARVIHRLLTRTFLVKGKEETRRDFYFLERQQALVRDYLAVAGWELRLDRAFGVAQAVAPDGSGRLSLDLLETLTLLILRLIYEEKRQELSLVSDVLTTVQEVQDKYLDLRLRNRPLDRKALKQNLGLFARFDLLEPLEQDLANPETRLRLYPSILFAVKADTLAALHSRLDGYRQSPEGEQ